MKAPTTIQAMQFLNAAGVSGLVTGVETGMLTNNRAVAAFGALGSAIDTYRATYPQDKSLQEIRVLIGEGAHSSKARDALLTRLTQHRRAVELAVRLAMMIDAVGQTVVSSAAAVVGIEAPYDLGAEWRWIPPGEFMMGSADDDPYAFSDEKPLRRVMAGGLWMLNHTTTNAEWRLFLAAKEREDDRDVEAAFAGGDNQPAVLVNQKEAAKYSQWFGEQLSKQTGHPLIGRLPTEEEWEKAAKGPSGTEFVTPATDAQAHFYARATRAVDSPDAYANGFGLKDMIGNVWEWTTSPKSKSSSNFIVRGGAWYIGNPDDLRAAYRGSIRPFLPDCLIGFRPVLVPKDSTK